MSGKFIPDAQAIHIAQDQCNQQKESTLLHEILEALNFHLELKLPHEVITSLEAGLYTVLKENFMCEFSVPK